MKTFRAFIKPFEAPQRSVKIKIYVNCLCSSRIGTERVNLTFSTVFRLQQVKAFLVLTRYAALFNEYDKPDGSQHIIT